MAFSEFRKDVLRSLSSIMDAVPIATRSINYQLVLTAADRVPPFDVGLLYACHRHALRESIDERVQVAALRRLLDVVLGDLGHVCLVQESGRGRVHLLDGACRGPIFQFLLLCRREVGDRHDECLAVLVRWGR